jgi:hypothetical protein
VDEPRRHRGLVLSSSAAPKPMRRSTRASACCSST